MTAEEAYAKTVKAKRNHVLGQIEASVRDCWFKIEIHRRYIYKELEDELVANGYSISCRGDQVTISWSSPKKIQLQQSSRAITFS